MQPMLNIALRAARTAGEQILRANERLDLLKSEQSDVASFVKETCQKAELTITHAIQKAYPQHSIVGVYTGEHAAQTEGDNTVWHINAIDSTSNFQKGITTFALTMACYINDRLEHSLILNPMTNEEFTASRGRGAQLDGKRMRISDSKSLDGSHIGTGFYNRSSDRNHLNSHLDMQKALVMSGSQIHTNGSAALMLASVAAGRLDGFYQIGLSKDETQAAMLLVQEAGGLVSDFNGGTDFRNSGNMVIANAKTLKLILQTLRPAISPELG